MDTSTANSLIRVLLDRSCPLADRDDAAMDLGLYDEPKVLDVLIQVAMDVNEHDMVLSSCGESIRDIWIRKGSYSAAVINEEMLNKFAPEARHECNIKLPESCANK